MSYIRPECYVRSELGSACQYIRPYIRIVSSGGRGGGSGEANAGNKFVYLSCRMKERSGMGTEKCQGMGKYR